MDTGAIAYLNGEFLPQAEARVPVLDRGFLFADGVYEVIPVYAGKPFGLTEHLARLTRSLRELQIANLHSDTEWRTLADKLIAENGGCRVSTWDSASATSSCVTSWLESPTCATLPSSRSAIIVAQ